MKKAGMTRPGRFLTDFTGPAYTVVLEHSYESLAEFEAESKKMMANPEWSKWYHEKLVPHIESGSREIWTVVD